MCVTVRSRGVRGDQVYTARLGTDKDDADGGGRESKANTAAVNAMVFEKAQE